MYFVSSNRHKHEDVARVFRGSKNPPRSIERRLVEVLSHDLEEVVKQKAMNAYESLRLPIIVEHGALHIDHLHGLPGPMVKFFWEKLDDDLPALIPKGASRRAHLIQMVCFCDGKRLHVFDGRIEGNIAPANRGRGGIHWEPMFIPDGHKKTLGEMGVGERLKAHAFPKAYQAFRRAHHIF